MADYDAAMDEIFSNSNSERLRLIRKQEEQKTIEKLKEDLRIKRNPTPPRIEKNNSNKLEDLDFGLSLDSYKEQVLSVVNSETDLNKREELEEAWRGLIELDLKEEGKDIESRVNIDLNRLETTPLPHHIPIDVGETTQSPINKGISDISINNQTLTPTSSQTLISNPNLQLKPLSEHKITDSEFIEAFLTKQTPGQSHTYTIDELWFKLKALPHCYDILKAKVKEIADLYPSNAQVRPGLLVILSRMISREYQQRILEVENPEWIQILSTDLKNAIGKGYSEIIRIVCDVDNYYSKENKIARKYRIKKEFKQGKVTKLSPNELSPHHLAKLIKKEKKLQKDMLQELDQFDPIGLIEKEESDRWVKRLLQKHTEIGESNISDALVAHYHGNTKKADEIESQFITVTTGNWAKREKVKPWSIEEYQTRETNRIHLPCNAIPKTIELALLKTIYRLDLSNCHIVDLAMRSNDEALLKDLLEQKDIYTQIKGTLTRSRAKEQIQIWLNKTKVGKNRTQSERNFCALYPTAAALVQKLKAEGKSYHDLGNDTEQIIISTFYEKIRAHNIHAKYEHDGVAFLTSQEWKIGKKLLIKAVLETFPHAPFNIKASIEVWNEQTNEIEEASQLISVQNEVNRTNVLKNKLSFNQNEDTEDKKELINVYYENLIVPRLEQIEQTKAQILDNPTKDQEKEQEILKKQLKDLQDITYSMALTYCTEEDPPGY